MSCTSPLKAWKIGLTPSGKADLLITDLVVDHIEIPPNCQVKSNVFCALDNKIYRPAWKVNREFIQIPCGHCMSCRLEYSRQWANRCMLELLYYKSAFFVTLTYNENHVPVDYTIDPETGEAKPVMTLRKRDLQLFMKRLRKRFGDNIRFLGCGEYGSTTFRPHYHLVLFGLDLEDLKTDRQIRGCTYYTSDSLERVWSVNIGSNRVPVYDNIGFCLVSDVTWQTCAYVARYVTKKLKGPAAQWYADMNMEPPFMLMSRNPGIAHQWYEDHPDYHDYEYINVSTPDGGKKFRPPKYLDYLYDIDYPEESAILKEQKKIMAMKAQELKLSKTDLTFMEYLQVENASVENRAKKLIRGDI